MAKTERRKLIDKLDAKARKECLERDEGRCRRCHTDYEPEVHHVIKRENLAVRWDLDNLITLCRWECHPWAESVPKSFREWFDYHYPNQAQHIEEQRKKRKRVWDSNLEEML